MRTGLWLAGVMLAVASPALAAGTIKGTVRHAGPDRTPFPDAVVMVEGPTVPAPANAPHATMSQQGTAFVPHTLVVAVGTTVDFPNHDPFLHNVNSASPTKKFDLGMYDQNESRSELFDKPGEVHVRCNVHPRMEGTIVVHTNPYAAVTDAEGSYVITGVPAGTYTLRAWADGARERQVPVTVQDAAVAPVNFQLETE
jgi:plastocyanin